MKRLILRVLFLAGSTFLGMQTASAVTIDFNPGAPALVSSGDNFSVDIVASGLGASPADIVSAFDALVSYDNAVVTPTGYSYTTNLGDPFFFEALTQDPSTSLFTAPGFYDLAEVSLLSDADLLALQTGLASYPSITLATVDFSAIGNGDPNLGFVWDKFHDVKGSLATQIYPVHPAPEPSTVLLFGAGIAGLGLSRRKRRA